MSESWKERRVEERRFKKDRREEGRGTQEGVEKEEKKARWREEEKGKGSSAVDETFK